MSTDTQAVETKVENAAAQSEVVATQNATEVDYGAELAKKDAEIAEVRKEKDNYKRGLLKAKGKLPEEDDNSSNEEDLDAKIDRKVQEKLLSTRESQLQSERDALVARQAKEIKELRTALRNRGQISTTSGQGSNEDKPEVKVETVLSKDQITSLKAKGWSDAKIEAFKANLKMGTAQAPLPK